MGGHSVSYDAKTLAVGETFQQGQNTYMRVETEDDTEYAVSIVKTEWEKTVENDGEWQLSRSVQKNGIIYKVEAIAPSLFENKNISSLSFKMFSDITIGKNAFSGCSDLYKVYFPASVQIEESAFSGCISLNGVDFRNGQKIQIGKSAFSGCINLKKVTLSGEVSVGQSAFQDCKNLHSVELYRIDNIIVESSAFSGCTAWEEIRVDEDDEKYAAEDGILYNKEKTELIWCPVGKSGKISIPEETVRISENAFANCANVDKISIPVSIKEIGNNAFEGCDSLNGIYYAGSEEQWKEIVIADNGNQVLQNTEIHFNAQRQPIVGSVFEADMLKFLVISALTDDEGEVEVVGFSDDAEHIAVPDTIENAGINYKVVAIGDDAFRLGKQITDIAISEGITRIGENAFSACTALNSIYIPESITEIGSNAFSGCQELTVVSIPADVSKIGSNVFDGCIKLKSIEVDEKNKWYMSDNGVLYDQIKSKLLRCPQGKVGSVNVLEKCNGYDVINIESRAFYGCNQISSIYIPTNIKGIILDAFGGWNNKKDIFYAGSKKQWQEIDFNLGINADSTDYLSNLIIHYQISDTEDSEDKPGAGEDEENHTHTVVIDAAEPADCVNTGKTEGSHCATCGEVIQKQEIIPQTGHHYEVVLLKATVERDGTIYEECSVCGNIKEEEVIYSPKELTLSHKNYVYDKKQKKPQIMVRDRNGDTVGDSFYTVRYEDNKNVGYASVKVIFKGNYEGILEQEFIIRPKASNITKLTADKKSLLVKWKKQSSQINGYEIQYSTDRKFKKTVTGTVKIGKKGAASTKLTKLKTGKKYYVRIRTFKTTKKDGKSIKIYSDWSNIKSAKIKK